MSKPQGPWLPCKYEAADIVALQALQDGRADPDQQKRALNWILYSACGFHDEHYYPGQDGARDTVFALGKQKVGHEIRKLLMLNHRNLRRRDDATG